MSTETTLVVTHYVGKTKKLSSIVNYCRNTCIKKVDKIPGVITYMQKYYPKERL